MRCAGRILWVLAIMLVSALAAHAQAPACTGPLATIFSPAPGSTLPAGDVTFQWCNANADYFLTIESTLGAHDIFNAIVRVNTLTLGTGCATAPPFGCIPPNGETIFVTLWTQTNGGKTFQAAPLVVYSAASSGPVTPSPSTTTAGNASASFSNNPQNVTLTAAVTSTGGLVNQGTVTFQVLDGAVNIGSPVTTSTVTSGSASATYLLPGGTSAKNYTIRATYSGGTNFEPSSGAGTLTVNPGPPAPAATTTTVNPQSATFSAAAQNVTLTATVSANSTVNEGTVTFQLVDSTANPVGTAVSSATLSNGTASVIYPLPAGLTAASYTIEAAYSGGTNFQPSSNTATLTVNPVAPPPGQSPTTTNPSDNAVAFSRAVQHVTLTAAVEVPGVVVNEGTVTFQVMDGATKIGQPVPSSVLTNGNGSVSYVLPAGTLAKAYTIHASYSGGPDFEASSGSSTLTVNKAPSITQFTSTAPASLAFGQTYSPAATSTGDGVLTIGVSGECSSAGGVITITAAPGTCVVSAAESEGANFLGSSATPQSISIQAPDFSLAIGPPSVTIASPGGSATASLTITGQTGYNGTIAFTPASCTGLPAKSACSFSPSSVTGSGNTTITITTAAPQSAGLVNAPTLGWSVAGGFTLAGVLLLGIPRPRRRWTGTLGLLLLGLLWIGAGCGGSAAFNTAQTPGTPTGTFTVTVTASSGGLTHNTAFTLNVQ